MMEDPHMTEVAERFGLGRPHASAAVARGAMGRVTRLDTDNGSWAVKQLFPWARTDNVDAEVELAEAAVAAGILTPAPRRGHAGRVIETVGDDRYRVWEWAEITDTPQAPASPDFAHRIGAVTATIHGLARDCRTPVTPWLTTHPPSQRWDDLLDAAHAAGATWARLLASALPSIRSLETVADQPMVGRPVQCHNDLGPGNVGIDARDRPVVLDWEHAGPQVPAQDLGYMLVAWCIRDGAVEAATTAALVTGYREIAHVSQGPDLSTFAGVACATLNFLAGQAQSALTATDAAQKSFAVNSVSAYCRHPLSQATLAELLDVV